MRDGHINHLHEELGLARKNKGKKMAVPSTLPIVVQIRGEVAVAYGVSAPRKMADGTVRRSYFADYYVWENGSWHVYFAQQTSFPA